MIRRTRSDVREYFKNDIEKQGLFFPEVDTPNRIIYQFDDKTDEIFNETVLKLRHFTFARYQPGRNLLKKFELSDFAQTQERNLVGFMKTMLVKRLESSKICVIFHYVRFQPYNIKEKNHDL